MIRPDTVRHPPHHPAEPGGHAVPSDTGMLTGCPAGDEERAREAGRTDRRLLAEFGALVAQTTVTRIVRSCREDLRGAPPGALPELVERLARQRLRQALPPGADPTGTPA